MEWRGDGWKSFDPDCCWPQKKLPMAPGTARHASFLQPMPSLHDVLRLPRPSYLIPFFNLLLLLHSAMPFCANSAMAVLLHIASKVIGSLQHFSILLLSFIAGAWLEGTCNLAMTMTMKGFKFFVSSTQPPTSFPVRQQHLAPSPSQKVLIDL